jgi:adenosylcobinamide kinase/adenosylcobinamide-phosphate guanylyltransferase
MCFIFVSGAARSGKSAWAEGRALSLAGDAQDFSSPLVYIATARVSDREMRRRVAMHRAARKGKGFETVERPTDVGTARLPNASTVLLECLGTLLANEMFGTDRVEPQAVRKIFDDLLILRDRALHLLVVSNDIFSDGAVYGEATEKYRRALGALHVALARAADLAVECAAGQAMEYKKVEEKVEEIKC